MKKIIYWIKTNLYFFKFKLTSNERLKIYEEMLKLFETRIELGWHNIGLCSLYVMVNLNLNNKSSYLMLFMKMPEVDFLCPIEDGYYYYWWDLKDTASRIQFLKDCIQLVKTAKC